MVGTVESSASALLEASLEGVPVGSSAGRVETASTGKADRKLKATPVARRLAAMEGIDLTSLHGSGPSGRILKEDILGEIETRGNGKLSTRMMAPTSGSPSIPSRVWSYRLSKRRTG